MIGRFVEAGSVRTYVWEAGDRRSQAVVLVHDGGYGTDAQTCWSGLLELLSDRFYTVAPDLTGFGQTDKVYRFDLDPFIQRVRHLERVCEVLEISDAAFIGASYGGAVVLRAAIERVAPLRSAVSISGSGGLFFVHEKFTELQSYTPGLQDARRIWEFLAASISDGQVEDRYRNSMIPGHWEALSAARLRNPGLGPPPERLSPYRQALGRIAVPVLFIAGSDDALLEPGWESRMAALVPSARYERIPGTRHEPHIDKPEAVARLLFEFLGAESRYTLNQN